LTGEHAETLGDLLATTGTKDLHGGAVGHHHGGHVLDDTGDLLVGLQGDRTGALGHISGSRLRGGHDQQLGIREQLGDGDGDVACSRGEIQQEDVQVTPEHIREELLDGTVQHRATPHHRCVALDEVGDGDHLHAVSLRGHDHVVDLVGPGVGTEHTRHGVAVNVGVEDTHGQTLGGQGGGKVDGHGGFAYPSLAGGHRVHTCGGSGLGEGDDRVGGVATQAHPEFTALFIAHDISGDLDSAHALNIFHRRLCVGDDGGLHRASRDGQVDLYLHIGAIDGHRLDHSELRDGLPDLWILYAGQRAADSGFGYLRH